MHHFIYPSQDTYISNQSNLSNKNFGLNEILNIGTTSTAKVFTVPTKTYALVSESVQNFYATSFTGLIESGTLIGKSNFITGSITGGTGSLNSIGFSGSNILSGSLFSGSVNGFTGKITEFSGSIISGIATGNYVISHSNETVLSQNYNERSLIKFDLTEISKSIASGNISSPSFKLKMKVAKEENAPLAYTIYAFPISQSWSMGSGYYYDGGSSQGASWNYRDFYFGNPWYPITKSINETPIDFISYPELIDDVWSHGGGTWFTNSMASQSFDYQVGDINMDVNNIVYSWLSGTIPNEGFILLSSNEIVNSNFSLKLFSKDTNTIYQPCLDVGWNDTTWITDSISTASVNIEILPSGLLGTVTNGASIVGSSVNGGFNGIVNLNTTSSGAITLSGFSGSILNMNIYGNISYSLSNSIDYTKIITSSFLKGSLLDGYFSGSIFTASINSFTLTGGTISGSWNNSQLIGNTISASYPFSIAPSLFVTTTGRYINGIALGTYITHSMNSGSFSGVLTTGPQTGASIYIPFTGSFLTASYSHTASIEIQSSSLEPLQFNVPFVTIIQNLTPKAKSGNILRVNVFSRPEFPFKNFERKTQFTQFLTPQYLPTSSYYSIKDNETEEILLDFDNYTQLSCDINGNYFMLDTTSFPQERYFKVLIKTEQSGSSYTFDRSDIFKIVR